MSAQGTQRTAIAISSTKDVFGNNTVFGQLINILTGAFQKSDEHLDMPYKASNADCDAQPLDCFMGVSILKYLSVHIITNSMLIDFMFYTYNAAVTTSDIYDCRMFRSVGAGSNIPHGLSSRRAVTSCLTLGSSRPQQLNGAFGDRICRMRC